ncbi:hypothetical protein SAXI111661_14015 [Saccharomonospora xinjiangensis]|nr:hypothetical protein [Saccharomonospora xinjiangensis]QBQ60506.1 hypothetical protein EYD13_10765 [Saccharomonospora xinjiangensis]
MRDEFFLQVRAPLFRRWLLRTGPLTADYADTLVEAARTFAPPQPVTAS